MKNETFYLRQLLYRLGIIFLLLTIIRLLFLWANFSTFSVFPANKLLLSFLVGFRFDMSSLLYANALFVLLSILPIGFRSNKKYQHLLFILFLALNAVMLALEIPDVAYFKYAQRRSGVGEFNLAGDFVRLIPAFIKSYWYLWILFGLLVYGLSRMYKKWYFNIVAPPTRWYWQWIIFILTIGAVVIGMRGGLQLRPMTPVSAGVVLKDARLIPLATNTTLNFIFSFQQKALTELQYFPVNELDARFALKRNVAARAPFQPVNVVLIILESFGTEYISRQSDGKIYAPFFDSLATQGISFSQSYANAQRSAQGIVSVTSGIPALMEEPFHFSPYQSNQIESIASALKQKGYYSTFFHGSNPGSMDFERFAAISGYDEFFDRSDYNNDRDYDGSWGIWDIPFFQWTVSQMNLFKKPFFCTLFSINPHNPFKAEKWFEDKYPNENPTLRCVRYTDEALRQFFKTASGYDWYQNTLFVLCADHTGVPFSEKYTTREAIFRIPILFYSPDTSIISKTQIGVKPNEALMSQIDILPSILDLMHYDHDFHCFGESIFRQDKQKYAYQYSNGVFQILDGEYILLFDGTNVAGLYNYKQDPMMKNDISGKETELTKQMSEQLKSVLQRYNRAMIRNELSR